MTENLVIYLTKNEKRKILNLTNIGSELFEVYSIWFLCLMAYQPL